MAMDDAASVGKVMFDQLEVAAESGRTTFAWDAQAWYGADYDKLWLKTEGASSGSAGAEARNELLWDHIVGRWWNLQAGARYDLGEGPSRGWAAVGVQGLAHYWFDLEATLYLGAQGRTSGRLRAEHDVLMTQRLIVQPELEVNLYSKADPARQIGSGLSDMQLAVRVRYEIRREIAPYLGLVWRRDFGATAQQVQTGGARADLLQYVAGIHLWL